MWGGDRKTNPSNAVTGGFWSGETLASRIKAVIIDPQPGRLEYNTYLLAVGTEIYVTPVGDKDAQTRTKHILKDRESYAIPPGQLALITTRETIAVPNDSMAFIAMRSKFKFRGLINVSGFSVDPGYRGKLIFSVYNAGPSPVHVTEGESWFTIFFAFLDKPSGTAHVRPPGKSHQGITSEQITAISADFLTLKGLDTRIDDTEASLEERLKAVERDNAILRWMAALIIGFLISYSVRACNEKPAALAAASANVVDADAQLVD